MNDRINKVVPGTGIRASWGNDVIDQLRRLHLIPGNGIKISTSAKGTVISLDIPQEQNGGGGVAVSDVIPCIVTGNTDDPIHGYKVELYPNGLIDSTGARSGTLYLPEVSTQTKLPNETSILAHVCEATFTQSDEEGDDIAPSQGGQ